MIVPTVGRVVWYRPYVQPGAIHGLVQSGESDATLPYITGQPLAALIAHVNTDTSVNLSVVDARGVWHSRPNVYLWNGEGEAPGGVPYCEWMPYQKGQAAKTEALERQVHAP